MNDDLILYRKGMEYGIGVDTPSGDARNVGVIGEPTSIPNASGSVVTFKLKQVENDEDLQTSMGVSASASGGVGLFSASASMDFAQSCHVHSNSVFLLVCVDVNLAFSQVRSPQLDPTAAAVLQEGNFPRFQEMYGDSFVRGIQTGGRFFSVAEIFTSTKEEQESLSLALQGSYGPFSAEGKFSTSFKNAVQNKSLEVSVHYEGGVVPQVPTAIDEIQQIAATFPASVNGNAVPYAVLLDKYSILDIPNPPNYIDLEHQMDVLAYCAEQRASLWTTLNNVDYVLTHPAQFSLVAQPEGAAPLVAYRQALEADLQEVKKAASKALNHPQEAALPVLSAKPVPMPDRRAGEKEALIAQGESMAQKDPLLTLIRDAQPEGGIRTGFYIGLATEAGNTLWGPGAQSIKDSLDGAQQMGFSVGAEFCLVRNNNAEMAALGDSVVKADPELTSNRALEKPGMYWLGFNIASGIFGDPALGAKGNTAWGSGAEGIRNSLPREAQNGFDAAHKLNWTKRGVAA